MTCSCCGEDRDPETMAELRHGADIKVCRECIGWLAQRSGLLNVTPTLPVRVMPEAISFYETAGFHVHATTTISRSSSTPTRAFSTSISRSGRTGRATAQVASP
jgi:hypothetical protein